MLSARSVALSASIESKRTVTSGLGREPRSEAMGRPVMLESRRKGEVGGRALDYADRVVTSWNDGAYIGLHV